MDVLRGFLKKRNKAPKKSIETFMPEEHTCVPVSRVGKGSRTALTIRDFSAVFLGNF